MMVQECTSTCYVLFWTVVVPTSDPKICNHVYHVNHRVDMSRLS
jgi:hypothetical protein